MSRWIIAATEPDATMNLSRAARSGAGMAVARGLVALRIEHVNVHAGGQAVVGNVETPGG